MHTIEIKSMELINASIRFPGEKKPDTNDKKAIDTRGTQYATVSPSKIVLTGVL